MRKRKASGKKLTADMLKNLLRRILNERLNGELAHWLAAAREDGYIVTIEVSRKSW